MGYTYDSSLLIKEHEEVFFILCDVPWLLRKLLRQDLSTERLFLAIELRNIGRFFVKFELRFSVKTIQGETSLFECEKYEMEKAFIN